MPIKHPVCSNCGHPLDYSKDYFGFECKNCKKGLEIAAPVDFDTGDFNSFEIELEKDPKVN